MLNVPVDDGFNRWAILVSCATGVLVAAAISLCDRRVREAALKSFSYFLPTLSIRSRLLQGVKVESLVSEKTLINLASGDQTLGRKIAPNGDCFFLCCAVSLLEYLHKNKEELERIVSAVNSDSYFNDEIKEGFIGILTQCTFLEASKDLEIVFKNQQQMNQLVTMLRSLMATAIEEEPDYEMGASHLVKVASKETIYADIFGSLDRVGNRDSRFRLNEDFTLESFKKAVNLIRFTSFWPTDSLIRALCVKLGIGFSIVEAFKKGVVECTCVEDLPSAGTLLLSGGDTTRHYTKIYPTRMLDDKILRVVPESFEEFKASQEAFISDQPLNSPKMAKSNIVSIRPLKTSQKIATPPPFTLSKVYYTKENGSILEGIEIKAPQKDLFFLGSAIALLDSLCRKNKDYMEQFQTLSELNSDYRVIMDAVVSTESENLLERVLKNNFMVTRVVQGLKRIVEDIEEENLESRMLKLFERLNFTLNISQEIREDGVLTVKSIRNYPENIGVLLEREGRAIFFPNKL